MAKERKRCSYPMSKFYIYEDEVPDGERVSTPEDCEKCDDDCCQDEKYCLISESEKPDYAGALYLAAKKLIKAGAFELTHTDTAIMADELAKAVQNYERNR